MNIFLIYVLKESHIDYSIEWLLKNASRSVIYLVHQHLLNEGQNTRKMHELWENVLRSRSSLEIFGKQKEDGSWCDGGSWAYSPTYRLKSGYTPVSPKYVTTTWLLSKLGEMGYTLSDPRIKKACEWVLGWQWQNGVLSEDKEAPVSLRENPDPPNIPCRMGIQLEALAKVGFGPDKRLVKSWELMLSWRRHDKGWLQDGHLDGTASPYKIWDRSCPWVSYYVTSSLCYSGVSKYRIEGKESLDFLLWHLEQKNPKDIQRFFWHGHEPIKELLMFSEFEFSPDHITIKSLLDWLENMYERGEGRFRYKGKPYSRMTTREDGANSHVMKYRMYHQVENDWLTYYATKIFSNFLKHAH
jgi:hypothetical protein